MCCSRTIYPKGSDTPAPPPPPSRRGPGRHGCAPGPRRERGPLLVRIRICVAPFCLWSGQPAPLPTPHAHPHRLHASHAGTPAPLGSTEPPLLRFEVHLPLNGVCLLWLSGPESQGLHLLWSDLLLPPRERFFRPRMPPLKMAVPGAEDFHVV